MKIYNNDQMVTICSHQRRISDVVLTRKKDIITKSHRRHA